MGLLKLYNGAQGWLPISGVGPPGTMGPQGFQGFDGAAVNRGFQGFSGPQGFSGVQGFQGIGVQGLTGPQGVFGYQGSANSSILQTITQEITADVFTNSPTLSTLMTQNITTNSGTALMLIFNACASTTAGNKTISFVVSVDGTPIKGTNINTSSAGTALSATILYRNTGLSASTHTILVQWASSGTADIYKITNAPYEYATLFLQEQTV